MPSRIARVQLSHCGHIQTYEPRPTVGETLYCRRCRTWRKAEVLAVEWHDRCLVCRFSKYYGEDKTTAMRAAVKHVTDYPSHSVKAQYGIDDPLIIGAVQAALLTVTEL